MVSQKDEEHLGHNEMWNIYVIRVLEEEKENVTAAIFEE